MPPFRRAERDDNEPAVAIYAPSPSLMGGAAERIEERELEMA